MDIMKIKWEDMDWLHLSQDRDQWRSSVNAVMVLSFEEILFSCSNSYEFSQCICTLR